MMPAAEILLEIEGLGLRAGRQTLVRALSMSVRAGEFWCVLGANGAGKTTFLESIVGLREVESGSIRLGGRTLDEWPARDAARKRAFLPQKVRDSFSASVMELVLLGRHPHMGRWAWEGEVERKIACSALAEVGLADLAERDIITLSGGERQRVAIAALIAQEAPLLILDEPAAHLDLHHQHAILERLRGITRERGHAVVMSLHDANLAAQYGTHAMIFHGDGHVDHGGVSDVLNERTLSMALKCRMKRVDVGARSVFLAA